MKNFKVHNYVTWRPEGRSRLTWTNIHLNISWNRKVQYYLFRKKLICKPCIFLFLFERMSIADSLFWSSSQQSWFNESTPKKDQVQYYKVLFIYYFKICLIFCLITSHRQSSFNWTFPQSFQPVFLVIIIIISEKRMSELGQLQYYTTNEETLGLRKEKFTVYGGILKTTE